MCLCPGWRQIISNQTRYTTTFNVNSDAVRSENFIFGMYNKLRYWLLPSLLFSLSSFIFSFPFPVSPPHPSLSPTYTWWFTCSWPRLEALEPKNRSHSEQTLVEKTGNLNAWQNGSQCCPVRIEVKCKGKGLPQEAKVAQGVPGRLRPRIFLTFGTTRAVCRQPYAPAALTLEEIPGTHF